MNAIKRQHASERKFYFCKTFRDVVCRWAITKSSYGMSKMSAEQDWDILNPVRHIICSLTNQYSVRVLTRIVWEVEKAGKLILRSINRGVSLV
jgi:hypothetical protein